MGGGAQQMCCVRTAVTKRHSPSQGSEVQLNTPPWQTLEEEEGKVSSMRPKQRWEYDWTVRHRAPIMSRSQGRQTISNGYQNNNEEDENTYDMSAASQALLQRIANEIQFCWCSRALSKMNSKMRWLGTSTLGLRVYTTLPRCNNWMRVFASVVLLIFALNHDDDPPLTLNKSFKWLIFKFKLNHSERGSENSYTCFCSDLCKGARTSCLQGGVKMEPAQSTPVSCHTSYCLSDIIVVMSWLKHSPYRKSSTFGVQWERRLF